MQPAQSLSNLRKSPGCVKGATAAVLMSGWANAFLPAYAATQGTEVSTTDTKQMHCCCLCPWLWPEATCLKPLGVADRCTAKHTGSTSNCLTICALLELWLIKKCKNAAVFRNIEPYRGEAVIINPELLSLGAICCWQAHDCRMLLQQAAQQT